MHSEDVMNKRCARRSLLAMVAALGVATSGCVPLLLGGAATGVLVATDRRTPGAQLDDQTFEIQGSQNISSALGGRAHVSVTSYNRQVLLTGEVPTEADRARAEAIMRQIENVRSVVNELQVGQNASWSSRSNDTYLTGKVKTALLAAKDISALPVKVLTERGAVYLMGIVTMREAQRASEVAAGVSGVQKVVRVFQIVSDAQLANIETQASGKNNQTSVTSATTATPATADTIEPPAAVVTPIP